LEIVRIEEQVTAIRRNGSTFYAITSTGALTVLHNFDGTDGSSPNMLLLGTDGNFCGTTISSGANGDGTVFEVTSNGAVTTLHNFDGTDGALPLVKPPYRRLTSDAARPGVDSGEIGHLETGLSPQLCQTRRSDIRQYR
jgi:uncharacterized repeat protein (TIGR03803 family)